MRVYLVLVTLSLTVFISCTTKQSREVANSGPNAERVRYLRQAADNGVLFLVSDSVLRDVPTQQVGTCRKSEDPIWANKIFSILEGFDQYPVLYGKIHVIEVSRGDSAKVSVDRDSDGMARLVVQYSKRNTFEKITPMTSVDCARSNVDYMNGNLEVTTFDWPTKEKAVSALANAPDKPSLERFNFNKKFLLYLADRMAILKVTQKQIYDVSTAGESAIFSVLNKLDDEISGNPNFAQIDYWIKEISVQSKQANNLVFFGLNKDPLLPFGVKVDSSGKINRKINNHSDPSYLYLSFKESEGKFEITRLQDLNSCLVNLSKVYKSRYSGSRDVAATLELDEDSFLYPGYSCSQQQP